MKNFNEENSKRIDGIFTHNIGFHFIVRKISDKYECPKCKMVEKYIMNLKELEIKLEKYSDGLF